jgi:thermitase
MNKRMNVVCALLLLLLGGRLLGSRVRPTLAQSEKEIAQLGSPFVPGRILVKFRPETLGLNSNEVISEMGARDSGEIAGLGIHIIELPEGKDEDALARLLKLRPEVEFAELDRVVPVQEMIPNDPWYVNWQWFLPKISAPSAWSTTTGNANVIIAVIDTGIDGAHEDLTSKIVPGRNIFDNNSDTSDVYGHGTKVAGTAGAASNNSMGVASVAWGCRIMPIRVSATDGTASYSNIASGLTWAADHGARVANVSYIVSNSSTVTSAAQYFQTKGGVVTVSAGNYSTFDSSADNPYMLTISASDPNDLLYSWSNIGNNVDLAGPGWSYTTIRGGGYSSASGTSISAPIVAGVAALVISANPTLTGIQAQDILKRSADDLSSPGWDPSYGWGRVNAARAVNLALGDSGGGINDTTPPVVSVSSPANGATVSGAATVQVSASDEVGVASVSLSVDGSAVGTDTSTPYTFTLNTVAVANGSHTLTATATDAAGNSANATISIIVNNFVDTTAPSISITAPANGSSISGNVSVYVNAADNVRVARVELYVDARLVSTATSAPFTTKWNARREPAGAHTLQCKAYDAAGNIGVSAGVMAYR